MSNLAYIQKIILLLSYAVEPCVWIIVLLRTFPRKVHSRLAYILAGVGSFLIICFKQHLSFQKSGNEMILLIILIVYYLIIFKLLFKCKLHVLILCLSIMFLMALISEAASIGILLGLTNFSISDMATVGLANIVLTILSKGVLILMTCLYIILKKHKFKFSKSQMELAPILFGCVLWEIPCVEIFNNMKWIGNSNIIFFWLVLGQLFLIAIIVYMKRLIDRHNQRELEYELRIEKSKVEMEVAHGVNDALGELYQVKHEIHRQINLMQHLYKQDAMDEIGKVLQRMSTNLDDAEKYYTIANINIASLLNQKRAESIKNKIEFDAELMIDDFKMEDEDAYSMLSNIIDNAIDASKLVVEGKRFINLKIIQEEEGFLIECINSFSIMPIRKQGRFITTKKDKRGHGLGICIVKDIVEKYAGTAKFDFSHNTFTTTIYIPYN